MNTDIKENCNIENGAKITSKDYVLSFLVLIFWSAFFFKNGTEKILFMLGGAIEIYLLLPLILCISIRFPSLKKLIWSMVFLLIGLVVINYLYSLFAINGRSLNTLFLFYIILLPALLIPLSYGYALSSIMTFSKDIRGNKENPDFHILKEFSAFFGTIFIIPLFVILPIIFNANNLTKAGIFGYQAALGALILSGCIITIKIMKIDVNTLLYFAKNKNKLEANFSKTIRLLFLAFLFLVFFSFISEFSYRGHWLIWAETIVSLVIYIVFLVKISKVLFVPFKANISSPKLNDLPSIRKKNDIILIITIFALFILFDFFLELIH